MSRKRTGSIKERNGKFTASVPVALGATKRVARTFPDRGQAQAWIDAQLAGTADSVTPPALAASTSLAANVPLASAAPATGELASRDDGEDRCDPSFRVQGHRWADRNYKDFHRGNVKREKFARHSINVMADYFEAEGLDLTTIRAEHVEGLHLWLARAPKSGVVAVIPTPLDPHALVSKAEAVMLPGMVSASSIKRGIREGKIEAAVKPYRRARLFLVSDLYALVAQQSDPVTGQMRRGPKRTHGYSQDGLGQYARMFRDVADFARSRAVGVDPSLHDSAHREYRSPEVLAQQAHQPCGVCPDRRAPACRASDHAVAAADHGSTYR